MTYEEAMDYMEQAAGYGSVLGLENTEELLGRLGNPEAGLRFVHVAGTNGKGSTAAFISSILAEAGYRVGRYVSPVIFEYRERIQIQTKEAVEYITKEEAAWCISQIREVIEGMICGGFAHPTPFEIETAMAFMEFRKQDCDIVVLEVGLGGRLDATNVIRNVECAVITAIGMDHMQFLGDTLGEIACEKAGIIKEGCRVVTYDQSFDSDYKEYVQYIGNGKTPGDVIRETCLKYGNELASADFSRIRNVHHARSGIVFDYKGRTGLRLTLLGECQPWNAATALETADVLADMGYSIKEEHIYHGLEKTVWRGRFDLILENPPVIVDGAHNEAAARSLAASIRLYLSGRDITYVMGVLADKDYDTILRYTAPYARRIITITPDSPRALPSGKLKEAALKYHNMVEDGGTVQEGLLLAEKYGGDNAAVLVFGSLSFLGQVYAYYKDRKTEVAAYLHP